MCGDHTSLAEAGNRFIGAEEPWHLVKAAAGGDIVAVLTVCRVAPDELTPFIPDGAARLGTSTAKPAPVFSRITA